jgi:hypothetical protein
VGPADEDRHEEVDVEGLRQDDVARIGRGTSAADRISPVRSHRGFAIQGERGAETAIVSTGVMRAS